MNKIQVIYRITFLKLHDLVAVMLLHSTQCLSCFMISKVVLVQVIHSYLIVEFTEYLIDKTVTVWLHV